MDFDIVVTMLVSWAVAKLHKVAGRVDEEVDNAIDAGVDRLHDVVAERLGGDKALERRWNLRPRNSARPAI